MIQRVIGWLMLAFGLLGFASELEDLLAGSGEEPIFGLTLAAIFTTGGAALLYSAARRRRRALASADPARHLRHLEPKVLQLAQERAGRISAVEASAVLGAPFEDARKLLETLTSQGACQIVVTEEGAVVYRFPELEPGARKRDLLEGGERSSE